MRRRIAREPQGTIVLSLLLLGALGGCATQSKEPEADRPVEDRSAPAATQPSETAPVPGEPAPDTAMTDANIEGIMIAVNLAGVQNAQQAQSASANAAVKAFATQMITDHGSVNAKTNELTGKIGVPARASDVSRRIASDAEAKRVHLEGLSGSAFDTTYIKNEIAYQESVVHLLDDSLIPRAQNSDLKVLLASVRPSFLEHVTHAKKVRAALAR